MPADPPFFARNWRWFVLATLFFATFLNYLDRQTLSNAADPICTEFGLDNVQRGELLAKFVYYYAAAHLLIGPLVDRVRNFRWVFPAFVLGWSACNLLVAFARDHNTLLWLRAALGVFEAGNFPICLLLITRIFPPRERVLANGIFYSGGVIATLVAPKMVIYFATQHHWRWAFLITGGLGLVWLIPWLAIFRRPDERAPGWNEAAASTASGEEGIFTIFRQPAFWAVMFVGMGIIPGLYFMTQWLPSYLTQAWHAPYNQALGNRLMVISFCQDLGMWLGGGAVLTLAHRGMPLLAARRLVIVVAYACMMAMLWLAHAPSINAAVAVLCLYVFGLGAWLANQQAFKQDVTRGRVATVVGFVGFAETMLSAMLVEHVGQITQRTGAFGAVFAVLAALFTFSVVVVLVFMRERWLPART
ncbi:MAG: MFS transporter [Opitutaceae bacterium]|nr:MFS transporter [Opitutaceae bacterium]